MCTLIAFHLCDADMPLVVAANRDELLTRGSEGPTLRRFGTKLAVAPRDLEAGGTWWGISEDDLFIALTNRPGSMDPKRRSRGLIIDDALRFGSVDEAASALSRLPEDEYNPFNLFIADSKEAHVIVYDRIPQWNTLSQGVHLVGNADPDDWSDPKVANLLEQAEQLAQSSPDMWLETLGALCRSHDGAFPRAAACVHAGEYGTKSSTLLGWGLSRRTLLHAEGPPCKNNYQDLSTLLERLGAESASPKRV